MGLNQQQLQQRKTHRVKAKKSPTKLLKIAVLLVPALTFITICAIYGNHSEWQTAAQLNQTIKKQAGKFKTSHNTSITKAVPAVDVAKVSQQERVTPDYSGQGGLTSKENMLKLAASTQPELLRGHVAMPSYQISEPVFEGTSDHVLAIGVGINAPQQVFGQGNISIYGHNMGDYNALWPYKPTKFSALQNMSEKKVMNQAIYLSDGQTVYKYHVTKLNYGIPVTTYEASLTQSNTSRPTISLVTCLEDEAFWSQVKRSGYTNFKADKRIVLTGQLVNQKPLNETDTTIKQQLQ
ncbi:sortase domain-bontaining protein [Leuconostoc citreum]|uniref:sortase family protein n=1 Tax=Leuconostoc citreum TaxID=33964 RepID=UPI0020A207D6|nr:sortase [Leuconostoc citreum]MCP1275769.1 sortase [Leuconostoc citreum]